MHYLIQNISIEFDTTKKYLDYMIDNKHKILSEINFNDILSAMQNNQIPIDDLLKSFLLILKRWIVEAPRKRAYRNFIRDGIHVCSSEYFFQNESNSDEILEGLENTGHFASYLLHQLYQCDDQLDVHEYASSVI